MTERVYGRSYELARISELGRIEKKDDYSWRFYIVEQELLAQSRKTERGLSAACFAVNAAAILGFVGLLASLFDAHTGSMSAVSLMSMVPSLLAHRLTETRAKKAASRWSDYCRAELKERNDVIEIQSKQQKIATQHLKSMRVGAAWGSTYQLANPLCIVTERKLLPRLKKSSKRILMSSSVKHKRIPMRKPAVPSRHESSLLMRGNEKFKYALAS